jgi:phosphonate transport system substrate-binding protein
MNVTSPTKILFMQNFINRRRFLQLSAIGAIATAASACAPATQTAKRPFVISAIPDQDPEKLNRLYGLVSEYLGAELDTPVTYKPVTDYTAVVNAFKAGDIDMVWFGGLTGVQARLQVAGSRALLQRDIDAEFHSVFIANKATGIAPFTDISGLSALKGRALTFGSDSSTSGRLMPQFFMKQAGVALTDLKGEAGFSGSHDKTIKLVEAGSYEVGALNEQVWKSRVEKKEVDLSKVDVVWRTPAYFDYHWIARPDVDTNFGTGFTDKVSAAFTKLNTGNEKHKAILDLFGAKAFIPTSNDNYRQIEEIGREIGKIK